MTMKLKLVHRCNFRRSEATNFAEAVKSHKLTLGPNDVVMLQSMTGDQLVFVWRSTAVSHRVGSALAIRNVLRSERLRLDGGQWDPMLIVTYATRAGIRLDNLDLYRRADKHLRRAA